MILYRVLLHVLPRRRRVQDGDAMALVFDELRHATRRERGWLALGLLWMKETGGLVRFGWRERFGRRVPAAGSTSPNRGGWDAGSELTWAWRAVRARGWRAVTMVALLTTALTATALTFAATDSLVFRTVPYPNASELIEIWTPVAGRPGRYELSLSLPALQQWQKQTDLLAGIYGYQSRTAFVVGGEMTERIRVADIEPGLIEALGIFPALGRSFVKGDGLDPGLDTVLLSDGLARRHFGTPAHALGSRLDTLTVPALIVGVMPPGFAFPDASFGIWRAFDSAGPLARDVFGIRAIARMPHGASMAASGAAIGHRSVAIASALGQPAVSPAEARPYGLLNDEPIVFYVLLGAAFCLLLIACANVASLELAGALRRSHTYAVQLALGATRGTLARVALLEGAVIIGFAVLVSIPLVTGGLELLDVFLPSEFQVQTANPPGVDSRLIAFGLASATITWLLVSLPVFGYATRTSLLGALSQEGRPTAASRVGARLRAALTVAELAVAVLLVTGGLLYARSSQALLAVDKGFDSANLVELDFTMPGRYRPQVESGETFPAEVMRRVSVLPGVIGASLAAPPPSTGDSPSERRLEIDDRPPASRAIDLGRKLVDESYLGVVGVPLRSGRWLSASDTEAQVVVSEAFAQRFWPGQDPIGHQFREDPKRPWRVVVGVVGNIRTDARPGRGDEDSFYYYAHLSRPASPAPAPPIVTPPPRDVGATTRFYSFAVRLRSPEDSQQVLAAARTVDPRLRVTLDFVDDMYATQFSDTLLATRIVGAFAVFSFVVAMAGVYGVMAFLVAGRTREIGIRIALGADRRDISRLVLRSSGTMVAIGAAVGVAAALLATRWTGSQFFGVAPTDPGTYVFVTAIVIATSLLATWRPARAAARIDPAITLRTQ